MATAQNVNVRVYWDSDSDPDNAGYVVMWDEQDEGNDGPEIGQIALTSPLDADSEEAAIAEAAEFLGVDAASIKTE